MTFLNGSLAVERSRLRGFAIAAEGPLARTTCRQVRIAARYPNIKSVSSKGGLTTR